MPYPRHPVRAKIIARNGPAEADLTTDAVTYTLEVKERDLFVTLEDVTPMRQFGQVTIVAANPGDTATVIFYDDGDHLVLIPSERVDWANCEVT